MTSPAETTESTAAEAELRACTEDEQRFAQFALRRAMVDPKAIVMELVRSRRLCAETAEAALNLERALKELVSAPPALVHLEKFYHDDHGKAWAICRMQGQFRQLAIHPDVDLDSLAELDSWDYVCVHPTEMVVVGALSEQNFFFYREHGEIVDFRGYLDAEQGLVRVAREGQGEQVVQLSRSLFEQELRPPMKLILQRGDERFAIAALPSTTVESRFEVSVQGIRTRLSDLAGLDDVIKPIVEDLLLRLVSTRLRAKYGLRPLRGMILSSAKPGMGKTALVRGLARWLHELGEARGFDVALYHVKPNELKSVWHGGDARLVREELFGSIRARQRAPRSRPLFMLVVFDEVESIGKRASGEEGGYVSSAHNDAVQSLLAEMDGVEQAAALDPPAETLFIGLTNRPDMLDPALKRPGRFGDLVRELPDIDRQAAEGILAIYACKNALPWYHRGQVRELDESQIRAEFLRPALAQMFSTVVMRYTTDTQRATDVTAGEILSGAHYEQAMNRAVTTAALRELHNTGVPAVSLDDLVDSLMAEAHSAANTLAADRSMFIRQQHIRVPVARIEAVPPRELSTHRYLRLHGA